MGADSSRPGIMIVVGVACLAGAAVLAWLSSVATLRLERTGEERATVTIESKLFGLFRIGGERIDNVHSASMVRSHSEGTRSHSPDRLVFQTANGPVDIGYAQQLFIRDFTDLKSFLDDEPAESPEVELTREVPRPTMLSLASTGHGEWMRFAMAQLVVVFLTLLGSAVLWSGFATAFG